MPNPYLPSWKMIPIGKPRVFGNRVYIYGMRDCFRKDQIVDLNIWSAQDDNLSHWDCHGSVFRFKIDYDQENDMLTLGDPYADVIEHRGRYYLYVNYGSTKGYLASSDRPEGPFHIIKEFKEAERISKGLKYGFYFDPGLLIDDEKVYIYWGHQNSYMAELDSNNMYEMVQGKRIKDIISPDCPHKFLRACSPQKIGDLYYIIYTPKDDSRISYATSKQATGPFHYRGVIIDNGIDYMGGNNRGSICNIKGQWYLFYQRMTNSTTMSYKACVEPIEFLPDGSIKQVEMTSLGFEHTLSPYQISLAENACVLKGGCFIRESNISTRVITKITEGCIIGYKYFDFGNEDKNKVMKFQVNILGLNQQQGNIRIFIDDYYDTSKEIGNCLVGPEDGKYEAVVKSVSGRHSIFMLIEERREYPRLKEFQPRNLFELVSFKFSK